MIRKIVEKFMQTQIPLPTFEDNIKLLQFWIDQQDKWFYFETDIVQYLIIEIYVVLSPPPTLLHLVYAQL